MAKIIIYELDSNESQNVLTELDDGEYNLIYGGDEYGLNNISRFTETILEFVVVILAIHSIVDLVKSYIVHGTE
ncbi:hypothetical protein [Nostoc sp. UHCC 0870]|uniref:hypothetical protein n=1 Tax=Nostoc sp. UHCC 0870 TaxID=2914041 RepID=UPI001EE0F295|nr:hypothetical protein [Nostoc sp. UHCC 0870]UKP00443.1 hypothetical protein L6494_12390 [Nostoc sp. UHCC 0870]